MAKRPTTKQQVASISAALRNLGLSQGTDFLVEGLFDEGRRTGTGVAVLNDHACVVVSDGKSRIETEAPGFRVAVFHTLSGKVRTYVDNIQY